MNRIYNRSNPNVMNTSLCSRMISLIDDWLPSLFFISWIVFVWTGLTQVNQVRWPQIAGMNLDLIGIHSLTANHLSLCKLIWIIARVVVLRLTLPRWFLLTKHRGNANPLYGFILQIDLR